MTEAELRVKAAELYPYPLKCCYVMKAKIDWKRERWVKERLQVPVR